MGNNFYLCKKCFSEHEEVEMYSFMSPVPQKCELCGEKADHWLPGDISKLKKRGGMNDLERLTKNLEEITDLIEMDSEIINSLIEDRDILLKRLKLEEKENNELSTEIWRVYKDRDGLREILRETYNKRLYTYHELLDMVKQHEAKMKELK